jgi:hypothetical protein
LDRRERKGELSDAHGQFRNGRFDFRELLSLIVTHDGLDCSVASKVTESNEDGKGRVRDGKLPSPNHAERSNDAPLASDGLLKCAVAQEERVDLGRGFGHRLLSFRNLKIVVAYGSP